MNLLISNTRSTDSNTYTAYPIWLTDKPVHLFLASQIWESLTVELTDDIPTDVLKYLAPKCKDIHVTLTDEQVTQHGVKLLCELYPDKAGAIRKAAMLGRDLTSVVA